MLRCGPESNMTLFDSGLACAHFGSAALTSHDAALSAASSHLLRILIRLLACSNPAFEADGSESNKAKRTSSDWASMSLSRTGSPTRGPNAASALSRRCSEELSGSWIRPAAHHSRTGSVLSEWADSEGLGPPDGLKVCLLLCLGGS